MASKRTRNLPKIAKRLPTVASQTIDETAKALRAPLMAALAQDAGPDRRLSGLRNGKAQTVMVIKRTMGTVIEAEIKGGPQRQRAPWFWLNEGTKAGRRSRPVNRRRSGRVITYQHPGTAAKRTWDRVVEPEVPKIAERFQKNVRKALEG